MAQITKNYSNEQMNYWDTGITLGSDEYISSISISCPYGYNQSSEAVALYIGGLQLATIRGGLKLESVYGSVSGTIRGTTITASQESFSFRDTVTITYTKASTSVSRTIKKNPVSPSGAGSFTVKKGSTVVSSAKKNDTISLNADANDGYVFKEWTTSPANLPSNKKSSSTTFTMPDQNVTITANYWKLSEPSLSKKNMTGGDTIKLTITAQSSSYKHYYNLSFGSNMATGDIPVSAGTTSVNISVPVKWGKYISNNGTSKSGGSLTLKTYDGSTLVGSRSVSGLTYNLAANIKPVIGTFTTSIARTVDNVTYADIGDYYVQNHSGVRVQVATSIPTGEDNTVISTIASIKINIGGLSGNKYNHTTTNDTDDFTSGILGTSGAITITVTATDSRGRTTSATTTITVTEYTAPSGSLQVWRVNANRVRDDMGIYGEYLLSKTYSNIGTNTFSWSIAIGNSSESSPSDTGDLLPSNRLELDQKQEYTVTLTLADSLETTVITAKLPTSRFVMAFDDSGNRIGVMKFPNVNLNNLPSGKERTFEFSADTQIYIGNDTLEDYIAAIVNSLNQ